MHTDEPNLLREFLFTATNKKDDSLKGNEFGRQSPSTSNKSSNFHLANLLVSSQLKSSPINLSKEILDQDNTPKISCMVREIAKIKQAVSLPPCYNPKLIAANQNYLAYALGNSIRIINQNDGEKTIMTNHSLEKLPVIAIEWNSQQLASVQNSLSESKSILASLTLKGELYIGVMVADDLKFLKSKSSLIEDIDATKIVAKFHYKPLFTLTFPDLFPAAGICWSPNIDDPAICVYGGEDFGVVFLIWLKPSAKVSELEIPVEFDQFRPSTVTFFNDGTILALSNTSIILLYKIEQFGSAIFFKSIDILSHKFAKVWSFAQSSSNNLIIFGVGVNTVESFFKAIIFDSKNFTNPIIMEAKADNFDQIDDFLVDYESKHEVILISSCLQNILYAFSFDNISSPSLYRCCWEDNSTIRPILSLSTTSTLALYSDYLNFYSHHGDSIKLVSINLRMNTMEILASPQKSLANSDVESSSKISLDVNENLESMVSSKFNLMQKKIVQELKESRSIPQTSNMVPADDINAIIYKTCRQVMVEDLIPSVQSVVAEMITQISNSIREEIRMILKTELTGLNAIISDVRESISDIPKTNDLVRSFSEEIRRHGASTNNLCKVPSISEELNRLIIAKEYTEALIKALSAGNLDILIVTLKRLNPAEALDDSKGMTCEVLLSLVQQLACCLSDHDDLDEQKMLELKLTWLVEALTLLNPKEIQNFTTCSAVLDEVFSSLRMLFTRLNSSSPLYRKVKFAMRVARLAMDQ